ncbi:MAG: phosphatidate cytidylyltransferase [Rhodobacteraceae bacterium]|nr:phosphatidate cytidylyltransferase [Paracoccaceae bacterium]
MDRFAHKFFDLRKRTVSSAVILFLAVLTFYVHWIAFLFFCAAVLGLIFVELARMTVDEHPAWFPWVFGGMSGLSLIVVVLGLFDSPLLALLASIGLPLASSMAFRGRRLEFALVGMIAFLAAYEFTYLRIQEYKWLLIWVVLVVIATDVAGYVFGRLIGGPRLPEQLSPNKHWSGIVAGWISALLISLAFLLVLRESDLMMGSAVWIASIFSNPELLVMLLGVICAIASQAGDLLVSWVKRRVGVKDCSELIPGHGGVLDRFDGMIGAGIVLVLLHALILLQ